MTTPNEERELQDFESNMDEHRQKIFMQLNGFKLNAQGDYEYDADLKIPVEDLKNPANENYDSVFAAACEKFDRLKAATQAGTLNLDETTASVWKFIAQANDWSSTGGYAFDEDLGPGEFKVFGGGVKFNANSTETHTEGGMSIDPNAGFPTLTGSDCDWNTYKDDDRKNVAVLLHNSSRGYEDYDPKDKGGKGDKPIDVPPKNPGAEPEKISGPSILMVPPTNCRPGEVYCGGRCTVIATGVLTDEINCICLGACNEVEPGECNGFTYGTENECCQHAKYCSDGTVSCGNAPCGSGTADRRPLPEDAALAYVVSTQEAIAHDTNGIYSPWCTPVYKDRDFYPNPEFVTSHKRVSNYQFASNDFNFTIFLNDGFFKGKWKNHCLAPVAENFSQEIIRYSDSEEETYITVEIEELNPVWIGPDGFDLDKWRDFQQTFRLGYQPTDFRFNGSDMVENMIPPHYDDDHRYNGQPCVTKLCDYEEYGRFTVDPATFIVNYDRWVINVWTTDKQSGYEKITEQQYNSEEEGHIKWVIPSYSFEKYFVPYPWMAAFEKAEITSSCNNPWVTLPTTTTNP